MQAETQTLARKSVVGVFDSQAEADAALEQLRAQGVAPEEISVMSRDAQPTEETEVARPASPVAVGAATGATLGGRSTWRAWGGLCRPVVATTCAYTISRLFPQ